MCFAIVTHLSTVSSLKSFSKELKLHHATAEVRLFTVFEDRVKGMKVLFLALACATSLADEEVIELSITVGVVEDALSLLLIATCASTLLYIAFKALRHGVVDHEADIALVDAHTKSNSCDYNLDFVIHPITLNLLASSIWQFCVIEVTLDPVVAPQTFS